MCQIAYFLQLLKLQRKIVFLRFFFNLKITFLVLLIGYMVKKPFLNQFNFE